MFPHTMAPKHRCHLFGTAATGNEYATSLNKTIYNKKKFKDQQCKNSEVWIIRID